MASPIRMALQIPNFSYPGTPPAALFDRVAGSACEAEAAGFDAVLVMDHFYQLPALGPPNKMAVVGDPGMPRVSIGSIDPVLAALLAASGATTPSILPLP